MGHIYIYVYGGPGFDFRPRIVCWMCLLGCQVRCAELRSAAAGLLFKGTLSSGIVSPTSCAHPSLTRGYQPFALGPWHPLSAFLSRGSVRMGSGFRGLGEADEVGLCIGLYHARIRTSQDPALTVLVLSVNPRAASGCWTSDV